MMPGNRTSQEEQNGANFSSVATSSEEVWTHKEFDKNSVHGFRPESDNFDFGKTRYQWKGCLKRSRMAQISTCIIRIGYNYHCDTHH